ncbi:hypothetical protein RN22_16895 [Grimontia sp. AD028]|uniref:hypothetical protein n=1 Tax=Grimontia sp. AD028 TaxID=1581149 RepID=UPI00061AF434|nr:hypothetical protein [Grimontia sp. AD028]KKD59253.1 hypothetical protein RN22_16895 [Grimontia sp. AD028]
MDTIEEVQRKSRNNTRNIMLSVAFAIAFFAIGKLGNVDGDLITFSSVIVALALSLYFLIDEIRHTVVSSSINIDNKICKKLDEIKSANINAEDKFGERFEEIEYNNLQLKEKLSGELTELQNSNVTLIDNIQHLLERSKVKYFDLMRYSVNLNDEDIPFVWLDICWGIKKKYYALNYEKPEGYDNDQSDVGIPIQNFKAKNGVEVEKIYVIDSLSELDELKSVINSHIESDVKVKYILKSKLDQVKGLSANHLMSIDFSVVDDNFVIGWELTDRECSGGYLLFSETEMKKYSDYFKRISTIATKIQNPIK